MWYKKITRNKPQFHKKGCKVPQLISDLSTNFTDRLRQTEIAMKNCVAFYSWNTIWSEITWLTAEKPHDVVAFTLSQNKRFGKSHPHSAYNIFLFSWNIITRDHWQLYMRPALILEENFLQVFIKLKKIFKHLNLFRINCFNLQNSSIIRFCIIFYAYIFK